jgi:hypothetical protein
MRQRGRYSFTTYKGAAAFLGERQWRFLPGIRATHAERMGNGSITLRYHGTPVVTYFPDGRITLRTGGWRTATTKARINQFSPFHVWQSKREWFVNDGTATEPFVEGVTYTPEGKAA